MDSLDELARRVDAFENTDASVFQRKARILQSLWRIQNDYPVGVFRKRKLGSLLKMPWAQQTLANYLDDSIRQVLRFEVLDPSQSQGKLYGKPRIFNNLLSSQPLAFNLFAHLQQDLSLASRVFEQFTQGRCRRVTCIEFEHSPGRGDHRFTGDRSAFDVYFEYITSDGKTGFIGIEVKYHEDLNNPASRHHARYDEVARCSGCFDLNRIDRLKEKPLQQIWRDHLLALSLLHTKTIADGFFVFLSPKDNQACNTAVEVYRSCLVSQDTFEHWTLESLVHTIRQFSSLPWIDAFYDRYLDFDKINRYTF